MKKIVALILTLAMLVSCGFTLPVSAAEAEDEGDGGFSITGFLASQENVDAFKQAISNYDPNKMPAPDTENVDELLASGALAYCSMLGITIDFLYNSTKVLQWGSLYERDSKGDIIYYGENGVEIPESAGGQPKLAITKGDIALAKANLNMYLKRVLTNNYGGDNFYTDEMATLLTNMLGRMFYPNYKEEPVTFPGTQRVTEDEFYKTVVEKSGFGDLLQSNWCDQPRIDFKPVLTLFGLSLDDVLESEYRDGHRLAVKLVKACVSKFFSEGPINFILDIVWSYARAYSGVLYAPTSALFALKFNSGIIGYEELQSFDGLINLVANNNDQTDLSKMQFLTTPIRRFGMASDTNELFLYLLVYLNLNCLYKNNKAVVEGYKGKVAELDIDPAEKLRITTIIDGLLSGRLDTLVEDLGELYVENIDQLSNDFMSSIKRAITKFLQKIAEFFDNWFKILSGEKEFGT